MTDCDKAKEFISEYIEKRLTPGLKDELDNHFQTCPECKVILDRIPKMQTMMNELKTVHCSEDFNLKLRQKIASKQNEPFLSRESFKKVSYGFSFAVFILMIVFGFNFFNQADTNPELNFPQVQSKETFNPSNTTNSQIHQASTNLNRTDELEVRTKDSETINPDSSKTNPPDIKDPRVKYVDSKK